ncbi:protein of unknown function [Burkholderia multivorans]
MRSNDALFTQTTDSRRPPDMAPRLPDG